MQNRREIVQERKAGQFAGENSFCHFAKLRILTTSRFRPAGHDEPAFPPRRAIVVPYYGNNAAKIINYIESFAFHAID